MLLSTNTLFRCLPSQQPVLVVGNATQHSQIPLPKIHIYMFNYVVFCLWAVSPDMALSNNLYSVYYTKISNLKKDTYWQELNGDHVLYIMHIITKFGQFLCFERENYGRASLEWRAIKSPRSLIAFIKYFKRVM